MKKEEKTKKRKQTCKRAWNSSAYFKMYRNFKENFKRLNMTLCPFLHEYLNDAFNTDTFNI